MITLLPGDTLRVITAGTADVDAYASFVERQTLMQQNIGRSKAAINTATTTTLVTAPATEWQRLIRMIALRNKHAIASQTLTLLMHDGTSGVELYKTTLAAGEQVAYNERDGFRQFDSQGRIKSVNFTSAGSPVTGSWAEVVLGSDVVNNNAVANTMQDVTGLAFPVLAGKTYHFLVNVFYHAAATTTGSRWSLTFPASSLPSYESRWSLTTTSETRNALLQAGDLPAAANASSAATNNNWARIEGMVVAGVDGNVQVRFASEIAASAITAKAGSVLWYKQLT